ncbi:hypothetical protein L1049_008526 [Liquidambar formosana]|uniref:Strictosidine synthase conserved region domain-containing protein n=1 Tax=Liquidambar formosana TaxID=63359 RepID=A0AAP0S9J4_LIQFO
MTSKPYFTATIAVLISALIAVNLIALFSQPSNTEKSFSDNKLRHAGVVPIVSAVGPESFAFDPLGGGPYTGVSDGRIIKWEQNERRWIDFAVTSPERDGCEGWHDHNETEHICGRPLGLRFNETTGDLYIADAYMGLLVVGPNGGLATRVATQAQGIPLGFTNGLDIDQRSGAVYFSDSSSRYQRRNYISMILSGDQTGRLMKYDPESKQVTVLLDNLSFPNGVALSKDGNFILLAETTKCRILKYWLETTKAGTFEVFAELPGFPDNIKRNTKGEYWVGLHSRRKKITEWFLSYPWMGNALLKLPINTKKLLSLSAKWKGDGLGMRLSERGEVLEVLEGKSDHRWLATSEVEERNGKLWIGSVNMPFAGLYKM